MVPDIRRVYYNDMVQQGFAVNQAMEILEIGEYLVKESKNETDGE